MVAGRLTEVRARIEAAARRAGRHPDEVTLVAVAKTHPVEAVAAAYRAGQRDFGENRAAELADKAPRLPGDIRWHFVGTLQSRKAAAVRSLVSLLHSMDRPSLARKWAGGEGDQPPSLLQVNIGGEPQKHGVAPAEAAGMLATLETIGVLPRGLMAIAPLNEDPRPHFAALRRLKEGLQPDHPHLRDLSMGMTDDFEDAIAEGATIVRVGRAIFGPRTAA